MHDSAVDYSAIAYSIGYRESLISHNSYIATYGINLTAD